MFLVVLRNHKELYLGCCSSPRCASVNRILYERTGKGKLFHQFFQNSNGGSTINLKIQSIGCKIPTIVATKDGSHLEINWPKGGNNVGLQT